MLESQLQLAGVKAGIVDKEAIVAAGTVAEELKASCKLVDQLRTSQKATEEALEDRVGTSGPNYKVGSSRESLAKLRVGKPRA